MAPAGNDAQVRDLERIVARQPESKFFAALAEAYVERGEPARAIEVCERGLHANPGFVRGLVVYARALLLCGREEAAQEIYRQARAENPRDSSVSTTWGSLLASLGRGEEARAAFTESLRINPLDVDAKRMLAGLPAAAPAAPPRRQTEIGRLQLAKRNAPLEVEPEAVEDTAVIDDTPLLEDSGATEPHTLVAPTPTPAYGTRRPPPPPPPAYAPAPGYAAPPQPQYAPPQPPQYAQPQAAPPYAPPQPQYAPPQPQYAPPPPPYAPPQPPQYAPAQPPPPPYAPPRAPAPPPQPAPFDAVPPAPPPAPRKPVRPGRGGQARRLTSELLAARPRRKKSTVIVGVVVLLVVAAVVGGGLYLRTVGRRVAGALTTVDASLLDGSPASYHEAETRLRGLAALHPRDARIAARLAEVEAFRGLRFDGGAESLKLAGEAAARAESLGGPSAALTARALLRIQAGDPAGAAELARRAVVANAAPDATMILGLAEEARGGLATAEEQLALAWAAQPPAVMAGCELAAVQRRRGRMTEARATLDAVRAVAPQDLCARLEGVLVLRQSGGEGTRVEREALREPSAPHAALRARHAFAEALVALAAAEPAAARGHLERAVQAAPWNAEYSWALGRALLEPGGDSRRALDVLERCVALTGQAEAPLDLAEAQLRLGRAAEAAATLEKVDSARLPDTQRGHFESLRLWARRDQLQLKAVQVYCTALERTSTADDEVLLTCAQAAFDDGTLPEARRFALRVQRPDLRPTARGLALLAQGDPAAAAEPLARAAESHADPGGAGLLLAEALTAAGREEAARRALRRAVLDDAGSVRSRLALAAALASTRRDEAATMLAAVAAEKPTSARLACLLARGYLALGDHARATQALAALGDKGSLPPVQYLAGVVALAAGDTARAQQDLQAAAAADASYADPRFELARLAAQAGRIDDATARYDAAMRPSPDDPFRRMRLAVAQAQAGFLDEAERTLELARKGLETAGYRGLLAGAYLAAAQAAGRDPKQARRAESLFQHAVSLPGAPAFVLYRAARFHEAKRDLKTAFAEYRGAIERDPQHAEALLRLGLLLAADAKSHDEAAARLLAYLKLLPDGEHAERARAELKKMGRSVP